MAGLKVEFGLLIAYIVPGVLLLYGIAPFVPGLASLLESGDEKNAVITGFVITALAIVVGMGVSIIRFATVDRTFAINLKWSNYERYPHHRQIDAVEIDYSRLKNEGALNAFLEAKSSEKRPYQFYGNTLLVAILVPLFHLSAPMFRQDFGQTNSILWVGVITMASVILYPATRRSYSRYVRALQQLNEHE